MARNQFEEALRAVLTGGLQGASAGMASGREMEKALMLEKIKSAMQLESQRSLINQFGGAGKAKYSIGPSGLTATPMTSKELLEEQEAEEVLGLGRRGVTTPVFGQGLPVQETSMDGKLLLQPNGQKTDLIPTEFDKYGRPIKYKSLKAETEELSQKKTAEFEVKKQQLKKDLDSFFAVDDLIDRAEGGFLETRKAGILSKVRALSQNDIKGYAARTHDAVAKRLRVQLVRAAGDVGNINIVEQQAAEQMIPGFFDSTGSAEIKRAFLKEVTKAVNSKDPNGVRTAIQKFMDSKAYQKSQNMNATQKSLLSKPEDISSMTLGEFGQETGNKLKSIFQPYTKFPSLVSGTAGYESMSNVANMIQEYAKPILQGEPKGVIDKAVAEIVTNPMTYVGITNLESIKRGTGTLLKEFSQMTPKLMTEKWLVEKAGNLQTIGKSINKVKDVIYNDVYGAVGNVRVNADVSKLIKNSNVPKEVVNEIEKLVGKKITTINQAKQAMDIVKSRIPDAVMKGKTLGKGGLFQKGLRNQNLASNIKEIIYDSVSQIDSRTAQAMKNLDSYMGKEIYPLLEGVMAKVGRYGKPKTSGIVSTFSGSAGKASERLLFKQAPKVIGGLEKFTPTKAIEESFKKDLLQLSKNMEQVVKDWVKFQTRQSVKRVINPTYWFRRGI